MDETTYGDFPAALILRERVLRLDDPALTRKVSRALQDFNGGLYAIAEIREPTYRRRLALLWRDDALARVAIHPELDNYVRGVITTFAKDLL